MKEFRDEYADENFATCENVAVCMRLAFKKTGIRFVVIIDEYNLLVLDANTSQKLLDRYLRFLSEMFKSASSSPCLALAYLTGILPMIKEKAQSKLNNFEESTMIDPRDLADCIGFTDEEVSKLCKEYGINYDECKIETA
ncbi:MAG TPA: hypothetical protein DCO86_02050 [Spirochaetaceae bacterium]|nr:hypothetical protein [Spirochaetaceae bacterium]